MAGIVDKEVRIISKLVPIPLAGLHYQYIHKVTPIDLWNHDMSLTKSPHVELLQTIKLNGMDWSILKHTRYVQERRLRRNQGMKHWTDDYIKNHIARRWATYKSMKEVGFKPKLYTQKNGELLQVRILKEPFWKTRFGIEEEWLKGQEIYDGGGRSAAAYVLGWKEIPAVWVEDVKPGSKEKGGFGEKLQKIKGVWDWLE